METKIFYIQTDLTQKFQNLIFRCGVANWPIGFAFRFIISRWLENEFFCCKGKPTSFHIIFKTFHWTRVCACSDNEAVMSVAVDVRFTLA